MARIIRKNDIQEENPNTGEDVKDETQETTETETMLGDEIKTSEATSKIYFDLSPTSLGKIELHCHNCTNVDYYARGNEATLCCTKCGSKRLISKSDFIMASPEGTKIIRAGEEFNSARGGTGTWAID